MSDREGVRLLAQDLYTAELGMLDIVALWMLEHGWTEPLDSQPRKTLDAAWAAVEAVLPEDGSRRITGLQWPTDNDDEWMAQAEGAYETTSGIGPTPALALLALAEQLKARP